MRSAADDNEATRRGAIITDITESDVTIGEDWGFAATDRPYDKSIGIALRASALAGTLVEYAVADNAHSDIFASESE